MHELTLASQIWNSVARQARAQGGGRVLSIALELGELNLVTEEQIGFWIRQLAAREGSPDVEVKITLVKGQVDCRDCGRVGEPSLPEGELDHHLPLDLTCPYCGSRNVEISGGREVRVVSAEISAGAETTDQE